jgi:hypothetical protein
VAGGDLSAGRAAAANALMEAGLDLTAKLRAAGLSLDRYAGAAAAEDLFWASQQAAALLYYKQEAGAAMIETADRIDDLLQVLRDEGVEDLTVSLATVEAYQDRLDIHGFTAEEVQAAQTIGIDADELEAIRQARIAADPAQLAGSVMGRLEDMAAAFRPLGDVLMSPPNFPGSTTRNLALAAGDNKLVRIFEHTAAFQLANPLTETATIELRIRQVNLPLDWKVTVSPAAATLAPGELTTVTVTMRPGTAAVQGTQPRVAVEGYVDDELIGGVALGVMLPQHVSFVGPWRISLPLVLRD